MITMRMDMERLTLLIERMRDAELLPEAEEARLFIQTEAARQSLEESDTQAARRHIEQIVRFTEALVTTHTLSQEDGCAVIETARRILASDTD